MAEEGGHRVMGEERAVGMSALLAPTWGGDAIARDASTRDAFTTKTARDSRFARAGPRKRSPT
jgi:hypothetical protein